MNEKLFLQAIKELGAHCGKKIKEEVSAIRDTPQKIIVQADKGNDGIKESVDTQTATLSHFASRIENAINKIKEPKFSGDISIETSSLENELSGIAKDLKKITNIKQPDLNNVEFLLKQVTNGIKDISPEKTLQEINKSLEAILNALGGIKPIDTFKLDEMQLRKLAGANKGISVDGGQMAARNVAITNLALTATNTQYTHIFKANTTGWRFRLRDQGVLTYYSFTTGTLPVVGGGGDGSNYMTIPQNFVQSQEGVDFSGKTIYFGAESASQIIEIETFQL